MECDYYIIKQLQVEYIDDDDLQQNVNIELDRKNAYFYNDMDSVDSDDTDDESFTNKFNRKYHKYLKITYLPRVLFQNGKWENTSIQGKYLNNIIQEIGDEMLLKITKTEIRYLS